MKLKKFTALVLAACMTVASMPAFAAVKTDETATQVSGEYTAFEQIADYVSQMYIDPSYTKEEIMQKGLSKLLADNNPLLIELLKSTLASMDDYSEFFTEEEYKEYQDNLNNTFYGIGVIMRKSGDYIEIIGFAEENSTAEDSGFCVGDKIYKVDGTDVTGMSLSDVREKIIGEENTTVKITVLRGGREVELVGTRVAIHESSVTGGILNGNIGYITISSFNIDTTEEFEKTLATMRENDVKKLILDLRNNPGGLVSAAVDIAKLLVPKGKIIDVKYRQSEYNATYNSQLRSPEFDLAVLVNENTASAAEILSSAIQDSGQGKLVGQRTYGKAVIQNPFLLTNGMVFKLTVGQYITRNGREINHVGLEPDKAVENEIRNIDMSDYTAFDFTTRQSLGNSHNNVKAAKEKLHMLGFYNGDTESDVFDRELKETLEAFQRTNALMSYGVLDIPTQEMIDRIFSEIRITEDNQLTAAYELMGGNADELYIK